MGLTITPVKRVNPQFIGKIKTIVADIAFDSSLADNGETVDYAPAGVKAAEVFGVDIIGVDTEGQPLKIEYNHTSNKLVVSEPQPMLIVEEVVTVASNVGTLQKIPGYILAVEVTAGTVTGAFRVIPVGETPTTTMVAVDLTTGAMTFLSTDAVTSVRVTYIPLGVGPFIEANRVVDEAVTFGSGAGDTFDLANRAALIQYVWNDTATGANRLPMIQPVGESPSTNQIAVDIVNSSATTITNNNAQDTNVGKVTYWKHSAFGAKYGFTDQADIAATSNAIVIGEVLDLGGILIPAFGNVLVGEATATNKQQRMVGPSGSAATDVAVFDPIKGTITFAGGDSITTCEIPYIVLRAETMDNQFAEVPAGRDLSGVSVRAIIYTHPGGV